MIESGTSAMGRAEEHTDDDATIQELQRHVNETRDSLSHTVSEIGNVVKDQVEAVKETLDWRQHVKRNPVAWSLGALGASAAVGYVVASSLKSPKGGSATEREDWLGSPEGDLETIQNFRSGRAEPKGPGLVRRLANTAAYDRVREEAATIGNNFLGEVSGVAKQVLVPAAIGMLKEWLGKRLPQAAQAYQGDNRIPTTSGRA